MLVELTRNETVIGQLEIALTVELVEQELMNATGNLQVCRQQHPPPFLFCAATVHCSQAMPFPPPVKAPPVSHLHKSIYSL